MSEYRWEKINVCVIWQIHQGETLKITSSKDVIIEIFIPKIEIPGLCWEITSKRRCLGLVCMLLFVFVSLTHQIRELKDTENITECIKAGKTLKLVTRRPGQDKCTVYYFYPIYSCYKMVALYLRTTRGQ